MLDAIGLPHVPSLSWAISRRKSLMLAGALVVSAVGIAQWVSAERPLSVVDARQFLQQSGDKLAAILNSPGEWPDKRPRVQPLIDQTMDVSGMARFALARTWNAANETQRNEIVRLFSLVLVSDVGWIFGGYEGFTFVVQRATEIDDAVEVSTRVWRWGDAPRAVTWLVAWVDGAPKIVDIIAEGTSLRITQRENCVSFLRQNNYSIPALIESLRQEAETTS